MISISTQGQRYHMSPFEKRLNKALREMEEASDVTIFVDLDETLVRTLCPDYGDKIPEGTPETATRVKRDGSESKYYSIIRPGAEEFLKQLRTLANKVYILTSGGTAIQSQVISRLGLDKYVDGVFGSDRYTKVPKGGITILIDDSNPRGRGVRTKMVDAMGVEEGEEQRQLVTVPGFMGDPNDAGLTGVADEVKAKIADLRANPPAKQDRPCYVQKSGKTIFNGQLDQCIEFIQSMAGQDLSDIEVLDLKASNAIPAEELL